MTSQEKSATTDPIKLILKDPKNTFIVRNIEQLPPLRNPESQEVLKDMLQASTIVGFRNKSEKLVEEVSKDRKVREMLIKIKQADPSQDNSKYSVEFFPVYQKMTIFHLISNYDVRVHGTIFNLSKQSFKDLNTIFRWNFKQKYCKLKGQFSFVSPFLIGFSKTWGLPLDKNYVTDCRQFRFHYLLPSDNRRTQKTEKKESAISWRMKGYDTRLVKSILPNTVGIYTNPDCLKTIDVLEAGYEWSTSNEFDRQMSSRIYIGSDFSNTWYCKLMAKLIHIKKINETLYLNSKIQAGVIHGKNIIPHECFSRNITKWMGERSSMYANYRVDLFARGIPLLETLRILPSNYVSLWLSKNLENKIKVEAELGISIAVLDSVYHLDLGLFRMSGVKGEPRFGLKYEF